MDAKQRCLPVAGEARLSGRLAEVTGVEIDEGLRDLGTSVRHERPAERDPCGRIRAPDSACADMSALGGGVHFRLAACR